MRVWRHGWRPVVRKRYGRKLRFNILFKGRMRRFRLTRLGIKVFRNKRWRRIAIKRPYRRRRRRLVRRLRRRARRLTRRIKRRLSRKKLKRRRQRRRRRRRPIVLRKPRISRCGVRVKINRKWRVVTRYKKHFWIRFHKRRTRITFRKTKFRIYYKGKWRKRPSYRRIKVLVNKKYRYVKKTTRKGIRVWITRCYRRIRRIRFRNGRRIIKTKTTWTRITRHVRMRVRIKGKIYPVVRRGRQWYLRKKKKYNLLYVRGTSLQVRFKKKWKRLPGNSLQVWYNKYWRTVSSCCKILRLRIKGKIRRISLRGGGLTVRYRGRNLRLGQLGRRIRHARRKIRKRRRRRRRVLPRRRKMRRFSRKRRRGRKVGLIRRLGGIARKFLGKKSKVPKAKAEVNEPIHPAN